MYILIVITYLGGSAWGPQVSMQEVSSKSSCEQKKELILGAVNDLNKTNLAGGTSRREIISVKCAPK